MDERRLFFGMEINAPWPPHLPKGRLLDEGHRHLTLAFLGRCDFDKLAPLLKELPPPTFKVGLVGRFDEILFLPKRYPRVVAYNVDFLENNQLVDSYQKALTTALIDKGFQVDTRHEFMKHVTLARSPFNEKSWLKAFTPLPLFATNIHLFESKGHLSYEPLFTWQVLPPFEEIEHTADIAYLVRGESFEALFQHALSALCFWFPPLLSFTARKREYRTIADVVSSLNEIVASADKEIGVPLKAVTQHGEPQKIDSLITWEMVVDV